MTRQLHVIHLGRCAYQAAWARQRAAVEAMRGGSTADTLFLVEHPPVITLGGRAVAAHVRADRARLAAAGVECLEVDRGGDVTYHGPGQLVAYPILDLNAHRRDVGWMLRTLEQAVIDCLRACDIDAWRDPPYTGVWTSAGKIAAIGIGVRRWVTFHGTAINVAPDLRHFQWITPCGIADRPVTSVAHFLGDATPGVWTVGRELTRTLAACFDLEPVDAAVPAEVGP